MSDMDDLRLRRCAQCGQERPEWHFAAASVVAVCAACAAAAAGRVTDRQGRTIGLMDGRRPVFGSGTP